MRAEASRAGRLDIEINALIKVFSLDQSKTVFLLLRVQREDIVHQPLLEK
ncbi:hypothetical protein OAE28_00305 [bacterium]|nr:hypothetical protein [bacterium]